MSLSLDDVLDLDCVSTLSPLSYDLGGRYVRGAAAVLRRVLYRVTTPRGRLGWAPDVGVDVRDLENSSTTDRALREWAAALQAEAEAVDFVRRCDATVSRAGAGLRIELRVLLVDGRTYPLEVAIGEAGAVLRRIGA